MERNFGFRERMLQRHRYALRTEAKTPAQVEIDESYIIAIDRKAGRVIENAALDLQEYLRRSMDVSLALKRYDDLSNIGRNCVVVAEDACVEAVSGACIVRAKEGRIEASDHAKFLEDKRVYLIKAYANGMPKDNSSFLVLDISDLKPASLRVEMVAAE